MTKSQAAVVCFGLLLVAALAFGSGFVTSRLLVPYSCVRAPGGKGVNGGGDGGDAIICGYGFGSMAVGGGAGASR